MRGSPPPLLTLVEQGGRELDHLSKRRHGVPLEALYASWACWERKVENLRSLPWSKRRKVRHVLQEAERTADECLACIEALAHPSSAEDGEGRGTS